MNRIKKKRVYHRPMQYYRARRSFFYRRNNDNQTNIEHLANTPILPIEIDSPFDNENQNNIIEGDSSSESEDEIEVEAAAIENINNVGVTDERNIKDSLIAWAIQYQINHNAVNGLLLILRDELKLDLPKSSRTLLKTPTSSCIEKTENGLLWYRGIETCILHSPFVKSTEDRTIFVNFNMDGTSIHNSTSIEFWPILMNVAGMPKVKPFVIAIWQGKGKPSTLEQYLRKFVDEFNNVHYHGIKLENGVIIKIRLNAIICDTPARSYVKCMFIYIVYVHNV